MMSDTLFKIERLYAEDIRTMTGRQSQRQEDTYFQVMRIIQGESDVSQRELARRVGLSVGGLNYCLRALIERGWVKVQNFSSSRNKLGYVYLLTPSGLSAKAALAQQFLRRKIAEYEALRMEIEAMRGESDFDCTNALAEGRDVLPPSSP